MRVAPGFFLLLALALGCDRKIEPFVPGEEPAAPDLSKIFPRGAEQAKQEEEATAKTGGEAGASASGPVAAAPSGAADERGTLGPPIRGTVTIAPELVARAPKGAVLFLIARRGLSGPPTAVKRIQNPSFPVAFELGPEDRMIQAMPWSGPLQLTARLDSDGNATTRSPGDLQGAAQSPANPGDAEIQIVLDEAL
jgi:cytochrome c-type biogenesis protein CcmH